ncbi:MAG: hypothetical protein H7X77_03500 [Anaerolineae bacterium]|nr:hypothetical protein [Anaerolineae bacterium]
MRAIQLGLAPTDGDSISSVPLTFNWSSVADVTLYTLVVKSDSGETALKELLPPENCIGDVCSYVLNEPLPANGIYKWFVKTRNQFKENQSEKSVIAVDYPGAPTLQQPVNETVLTDKSQWTEMTWSEVAGATGYRVVAKDLTSGVKFVKFDVPVAACTGGICTYSVSDADRNQLKNNRIYKWYVQASNDIGKSQSAKFTFSSDF